MFARGCVLGTDLMTHIVHTLGWGLSARGSRGYLKTSGKPAAKETLSWPHPHLQYMAPKVPLGHCLEDCRKEDFSVKCHQAASDHTEGVREGELLRSSTVFPGPFSPLRNPSHLNFSLSGTCSPLPTSSQPGLQRAARGMCVSQAIATGKP